MNQLYRRGAELLLSGQVNWLTTPIRPWLVDSAYTFSPGHALFSTSVPASARAARGPLLLTGMSVAGGIATAMPYSFGDVPGRQRLVTCVVFVIDTADTLFWFGDTGFGLPATLTGAEFLLTPDEELRGFYRA